MYVSGYEKIKCSPSGWTVNVFLALPSLRCSLLNENYLEKYDD